ncbi:MAG TPA: iron-containing redox enzyme family protein [Segeticoccus sp.]|uniref:iron-containing redox enzyme family protein n=1 Tax=Segeticoccus sp. TaxID=2706531 RepID=UPI002D7E1AB4|nr:iron-containing redox enzyme family protein [Segeticoccus sp.]HET8601644.1 iron-containing redox enzyme family protein [Segeticoccus sp.]
MLVPHPRGPLTEGVVRALRGDGDLPQAAAASTERPGVLEDEDLQLALWMLFELHYRGFDDVPAESEWDVALLGFRAALEDRLEAELRALTKSTVAKALRAVESTEDFAEQLFVLIEGADGPSVAGYLQREATKEQVVEFLRQRSIYHLKEADPYSLVFARLDGAPKTALAELQYDEYGAGRPERLHQTMFGDALEGCGLDRRYGAYVDEASAVTLATSNVASLFSLQRRLRGAAMGHLAAFEATSSAPCRKIARAIERVGLPEVVRTYFDEHVEADAVHEQVAVRHICGALVAQDPALAEDVLFGAAACLAVDALAGQRLLDSWGADPGPTLTAEAS